MEFVYILFYAAFLFFAFRLIRSQRKPVGETVMFVKVFKASREGKFRIECVDWASKRVDHLSGEYSLKLIHSVYLNSDNNTRLFIFADHIHVYNQLLEENKDIFFTLPELWKQSYLDNQYE